jgi:hypothetical protein
MTDPENIERRKKAESEAASVRVDYETREQYEIRVKKAGDAAIEKPPENIEHPKWPGRPTRSAFLTPRGVRERLAAWIGASLIDRYDFELHAETKRADAGWESTVECRRVLRERTGRGQFS